jgi:energy-coupling factor transport system permease protein
MTFGFVDIHPVVKMMYFLLLLTFIMLTPHPVVLIIYLITLSIYLIRLRGIKKYLNNLKFYVFLSLIITLINPIFNQRGRTVLFEVFSRQFTLEALMYGLVMAMTFISIIILFQIFNDVVDSHGFIYVIGKFASKSGFLINMALRYIPLMQSRLKELYEIKSLSIKTKGLRNKIILWGNIIGIIFTWSFEEAVVTADSMESRGYGLTKRTSYLSFKWRPKDYLTLITIFFCSIVIISLLLNGFLSFNIYPRMDQLILDFYHLIGYIFIALISLTPFIVDEKERLKWRNL